MERFNKTFSSFPRNRKLLGLVGILLIIGAIFVFIFGDGIFTTLVKTLQGPQPVTQSKYLNKVSPHHKALIHKFKYDPDTDTLIPDGQEITYLEIPPLEQNPSKDENTYSFKLELSDKGKYQIQGWQNIRKDRLQLDQQGQASIKFFTPYKPNESLNIKSKIDKNYFTQPLKIKP